MLKNAQSKEKKNAVVTIIRTKSGPGKKFEEKSPVPGWECSLCKPMHPFMHIKTRTHRDPLSLSLTLTRRQPTFQRKIWTLSHTPFIHFYCFISWHASMGYSSNNVHPYRGPFPTQFFSHLSPKYAKFENDWILRNGHRIEITQPISMILASFSSLENTLAYDGKINLTFFSVFIDSKKKSYKSIV